MKIKLFLYSFLILGGICCYFVSPLDVGDQKREIFLDQIITKHGTVVLFQRWNGGDFYTTYLRFTTEDGRTVLYVLDPDDSKKWIVRLDAVDGKVKYKNLTFDIVICQMTRGNGRIVQPLKIIRNNK